jgi:hypothetical protein
MELINKNLISIYKNCGLNIPSSSQIRQVFSHVLNALVLNSKKLTVATTDQTLVFDIGFATHAQWVKVIDLQELAAFTPLLRQ